MYYYDNLLYAVIFSSPEIYECNIKRLSSKIAELAQIYTEKIEVVSIKDCNSILGPALQDLKSIANSINYSQKILEVYEKSKFLDETACSEDCKIYNPESC